VLNQGFNERILGELAMLVVVVGEPQPLHTTMTVAAAAAGVGAILAPFARRSEGTGTPLVPLDVGAQRCEQP
jgi:hypothetical protein